MENNEIEIPFGAKDSELVEATYYIPDGMEAIIEGDKVIIRKKESEDEKTRKEIISLVLKVMGREKDNLNDKNYDKMLDWLEKQKEKPIWTDNDRTMTFTLLRDVGQMIYISNEGKNERLEWLNSLEDRFNNVE